MRGDGDCPDSDKPCQKNVCDQELGCIAKARPEGAICAHSNPCIEGGVCNAAGKCNGAEVKVCSDKNPCTVDSCDALNNGACVSKPAPDDPPTTCDDGNKCTDAIKTTCEMKSDGGGWTRVDQTTTAEDTNLLLGSKGRMMLKCADTGVEHLISPATAKQWAWSNKKHAVAGDWIVKAKTGDAKVVNCGADPAFYELECGWGFGCSDGKDDPKTKTVTNKVMPGVKSTVQCTNTTTVQTGKDMSVCGSNGFNKYRVFVRSDD